MNNFIRKIGLIPAWINEFFHFCPLKKRREMDGDFFLNIGHRGSPAREIENTIPSLELAMKEGANSLEVDLSMTKDGEVVLWHDWDPNDTAAVMRESGFEPFVKYKPHPPAIGSEFRRKISRMTLEEFYDNFDYKSRHSNTSETANAHIPTLREFFEWSKDQKRLLVVFFDIKCPHDECELSIDLINKIKSLIDEFNPSFRIVMETMSKEVFETLKANNSSYDYSFDIEAPVGIVLDPSEYSAVQAAIDNHNKYAIALRPRKITVANWTTYRRIVRYDLKLRKDHNRKHADEKIESLICATVSKTSELKCLLKMGVGGIQTDFPDRLYKLARKYGRIVHPDEDQKNFQASGRTIQSEMG